MSTVAITGINAYFAKTVLPKLEDDPEIEKIIGIDVTPWEQDFAKVDYYREDVRSPRIRGLLSGADTLLHLAFIVQEIHDKKKTHQINLEGSANVFRAAAANGVRKIVYTSSIVAYGSHPDNPVGITEDFRLKPNPDSYYSSDKVAVERYLDTYVKEHRETVVTILRPPIVVGPRLSNFAVDAFIRKVGLFIKDVDPEIQFIHECDLGEALYLAIKKDVPGIYNIASDDSSTLRKIYEMAGVRLFDVSASTLKTLSNILFALRLAKSSQGWVSLMEHPMVISSEKYKRATGWQPRYTTEGAFRDFLESRS